MSDQGLGNSQAYTKFTVASEIKTLTLYWLTAGDVPVEHKREHALCKQHAMPCATCTAEVARLGRVSLAGKQAQVHVRARRAQPAAWHADARLPAPCQISCRHALAPNKLCTNSLAGRSPTQQKAK